MINVFMRAGKRGRSVGGVVGGECERRSLYVDSLEIAGGSVQAGRGIVHGVEGRRLEILRGLGKGHMLLVDVRPTRVWLLLWVLKGINWRGRGRRALLPAWVQV